MLPNVKLSDPERAGEKGVSDQLQNESTNQADQSAARGSVQRLVGCLWYVRNNSVRIKEALWDSISTIS